MFIRALGQLGQLVASDSFQALDERGKTLWTHVYGHTINEERILEAAVPILLFFLVSCGQNGFNCSTITLHLAITLKVACCCSGPFDAK